MRGISVVVLVVLSGCGAVPWSTETRETGPPAHTEVVPPGFVPDPILPPLTLRGPEREEPAGAVRPATSPSAQAAVSVVPQVERLDTERSYRSWLRRGLREVAEKLRGFDTRKPETLSEFDRLQLLQLKREALLLLLLTEQFDSEVCRRVFDSIRKHPQTNVEIDGLLFTMYQHLGEIEKRNEVLLSLQESLRGQRSFRLGGVTFCEKVVGYRAVVPVAEARFHAGEAVKIYGEFAGASSRSLPGGAKEQQIQVYLTVLSTGGTVVDTVEFLSRSAGTRRLGPDEGATTQSYFFGEYTLPETLKPGTYQLRLTATDVVGQRESRADIPFEIVPGTAGL